MVEVCWRQCEARDKAWESNRSLPHPPQTDQMILQYHCGRVFKRIFCADRAGVVVHTLAKQKSQLWWWLLISKVNFCGITRILLARALTTHHLKYKLVFWPICGSVDPSARAEDDPMKGAYKILCVPAEQEAVYLWVQDDVLQSPKGPFQSLVLCPPSRADFLQCFEWQF